MGDLWPPCLWTFKSGLSRVWDALVGSEALGKGRPLETLALSLSPTFTPDYTPSSWRLCLATVPMAASPSNQPLDKSFSISRSQLERGSTPISLYSLLPSLGDSFHPQTQLWPPGSHCCRASCWMVPLDSVRELGL